MIKLFPLKINIRQSGINHALYVKNSDEKVEIFETSIKGQRKKILETRTTFKSGMITWLRQNRKKLLIAGSGISAIVITGVVFYFSSFSFEERLYARYYKTFDEETKHFYTSREILEEAKRQYKDGDYPAAMAIFSSIPENVSREVEVKLYSGLTWMEMERFDESIKCFNYVISSSKEAGQYATWYSALCHVKQNELTEANKLLSLIITHKFFNHKKAEKLQKKISKKI